MERSAAGRDVTDPQHDPTAGIGRMEAVVLGHESAVVEIAARMGVTDRYHRPDVRGLVRIGRVPADRPAAHLNH